MGQSPPPRLVGLPPMGRPISAQLPTQAPQAWWRLLLYYRDDIMAAGIWPNCFTQGRDTCALREYSLATHALRENKLVAIHALRECYKTSGVLLRKYKNNISCTAGRWKNITTSFMFQHNIELFLYEIAFSSIHIIIVLWKNILFQHIYNYASPVQDFSVIFLL